MEQLIPLGNFYMNKSMRPYTTFGDCWPQLKQFPISLSSFDFIEKFTNNLQLLCNLSRYLHANRAPDKDNQFFISLDIK